MGNEILQQRNVSTPKHQLRFSSFHASFAQVKQNSTKIHLIAYTPDTRARFPLARTHGSPLERPVEHV